MRLGHNFSNVFSNILLDDLRVRGSIALSINRATISSTNCVHPLCAEKPLRRATIKTRFDIMKKLRFYIPPRGLACALHNDTASWSEIEVDNSSYPFTVKQIEEMVDLLRFEPTSLKYDQKGDSHLFSWEGIGVIFRKTFTY